MTCKINRIFNKITVKLSKIFIKFTRQIMRKIVFEQEISNQEANLIRMDVEVEAVESE